MAKLMQYDERLLLRTVQFITLLVESLLVTTDIKSRTLGAVQGTPGGITASSSSSSWCCTGDAGLLFYLRWSLCRTAQTFLQSFHTKF